MSMSTASTQRFKYNGKELNQHSYMMWYDYGARQSAPLLGRFTSMDQLCESFCERCWQYCCRVYCRNQWHAMDSLKILLLIFIKVGKKEYLQEMLMWFNRNHRKKVFL